MNVGKLSHRVTIERFVKTSDGMGGSTGTWTKVREVWAEVKPLSGAQLLEAQKTASHVTHKVRMRKQSDLDANGSANKDVVHANRLNFGGRILAIHALVNVAEAGFELEMLVEEEARPSGEVS